MIPGVQLREMQRNRRFGMCCGAGGGRMWMEEEPTQRVNTRRVEQALETNPDAVAVACPFCMTMIDDGLKAKGMEEQGAGARRDGDRRRGDEVVEVRGGRAVQGSSETKQRLESFEPLGPLRLFLSGASASRPLPSSRARP